MLGHDLYIVWHSITC